MHRFKSAILAIFPLCQNSTFEPVHEIQKILWLKDFFWGIMKLPCTKTIHNFFQGPPNPGFRSAQTETFFKKESLDLKNYSYLGFLWIPSKPGKQNWRLPFFWVFIIVKKQCDIGMCNSFPLRVFSARYFLLFVDIRFVLTRFQNRCGWEPPGQ